MKRHRLVVLAVLGALWQCADLLDSANDSEPQSVLKEHPPVITQVDESKQVGGLPVASGG